jgi:Tfp pilus assembly protein PilO
MNNLLARFSASFSRLSSGERMLAIIVMIVVFAAVNYFLIFPHFGDWARITNRQNAAAQTLQKYDNMIGQMANFSNQIAKLEGENASVPAEDQAVNFLNAIQNQAAQSRVTILTSTRQPERTNQFFLERAQSVTTSSGERELVDFLYHLGSGASLIRVRALAIRPDRPDASRSALNATVTLIASFQKKPPARPAAKPATPGATPAPKSNSKPATNAVPAAPPRSPAATPAPKPATPPKK